MTVVKIFILAAILSAFLVQANLIKPDLVSLEDLEQDEITVAEDPVELVPKEISQPDVTKTEPEVTESTQSNNRDPPLIESSFYSQKRIIIKGFLQGAGMATLAVLSTLAFIYLLVNLIRSFKPDFDLTTLICKNNTGSNLRRNPNIQFSGSLYRPSNNINNSRADDVEGMAGCDIQASVQANNASFFDNMPQSKVPMPTGNSSNNLNNTVPFQTPKSSENTSRSDCIGNIKPVFGFNYSATAQNQPAQQMNLPQNLITKEDLTNILKQEFNNNKLEIFSELEERVQFYNASMKMAIYAEIKRNFEDIESNCLERMKMELDYDSMFSEQDLPVQCR